VKAARVVAFAAGATITAAALWFGARCATRIWHIYREG